MIVEALSSPASQVRRPFWERTLWWFSNPFLLLPISIAVLWAFGRYEPEEIGHKQTIPLFLQGSTDWGGSNVFAVTIALYVVCGFLGALYLSAYLDRLAPTVSTLRRAALGTIRLALHWSLFLLVGPMTWGLDRRMQPNDFRNLFLLAALLFIASTFWIAWLSRQHLRTVWKLALAPLLIYAWLVVGADGNTAKAGQLLLSGQNPVVAARGFRHGVMLKWHALCDRVLGDLAPKAH